jgi:MFS family permease
MFTYITTTTVPSFPEIQQLFNISYSQVNLTVAIPSIGLALGPLFWSSLSDIYGRRVVFIAGTTIAFTATIETAITSDYNTYMAARALQGLGVSPAGNVGMAIIGEQVQREDVPRRMLTTCLQSFL